MALEVATYPASLVTTNPAAGDPKSEGDDHLRMIKTCLKNATSAPAFSASQSVLQAIASSAALTKVQFQTEEFDTGACFDNVTNYRFTPTVAGYYHVIWSVGFASAATQMVPALYKNGVRFKDGEVASSSIVAGGSALLSMNGTTDYLEVFVSQVSGAPINTVPAVNQTYFQAFLARLA